MRRRRVDTFCFLLIQPLHHTRVSSKRCVAQTLTFDLSFATAESNPKDGLRPIEVLFPFLAEDSAHEYVDRALDTLLSYEVSRKPTVDMEPFLRIVELRRDGLDLEETKKCATFLQNCLAFRILLKNTAAR